ncbi:MAG TPA: carboxypeptidase regulatory-like domain-containing protein [Longimicrobiaceae bacterium]|nr:carboxypeptidase regulatory-like domain-containing protein [Longimicrobiaceae bacterium]
MPSALRVAPLLLILCTAPSLVSQTVRGELVDDGGRPVPAAFVILQDSVGRSVTRALTGADGRFTVQASGAGRYTLRAERIGYTSTESPPLRLEAGRTVDHRLVVASRAVALEGIVVGAERRRCDVRPAEGLAAATLWEEARKALSASAWTESRGLLQVRLTEYQRDLDPDGRRVLAERKTEHAGRSRSPFVSASAGQLARSGYREQRADGVWYHAPDAEVLLSDEFLDTHCFRAVAGSGEERSLVGLAFEPVGGRPTTDVRGTLWLDPATRELRHLEYGYTRLPPEESWRGVGGRVEFQRLPNGAWIVRRWRIRMPTVAAPVPTSGLSERPRQALLAGFREVGGEVVEVSDGAGQRLYSGVRETVAGARVARAPGIPAPAGPGPAAGQSAGAAAPGTMEILVRVMDQGFRIPIEGVRVRFVGTPFTGRTERDGTVRLAGVPEGRYQVELEHPVYGKRVLLADVVGEGKREVVFHIRDPRSRP